MDLFFLFGGLAVLAVALRDVLAVTIGSTSRATLTGLVARGAFAAMRAAGRTGPTRAVTAVAGVAVMTLVGVVWIGSVWIGWSMIFAASPDALTLSTEGAEPEGVDAIAHAGHLLSTLGGARTSPGGAVWGLAGALAGVTGMVVLTLSVSFFLSVRQTVQAGRAFAMLRDVDAHDPDAALPALADLVSALNTAPFALYYGTERVERQLPAALLAHGRAAYADGGAAWRRTRAFLEDLPHLEAGPEQTDAAFLRRMERWADRHTVVSLRSAGMIGDRVTAGA